jgi:hypothetical protein
VIFPVASKLSLLGEDFVLVHPDVLSHAQSANECREFNRYEVQYASGRGQLLLPKIP